MKTRLSVVIITIVASLAAQDATQPAGSQKRSLTAYLIPSSMLILGSRRRHLGPNVRRQSGNPGRAKTTG